MPESFSSSSFLAPSSSTETGPAGSFAAGPVAARSLTPGSSGSGAGDGVPPELLHADHSERPKKRRRGLIVGFIALLVAIGLVGYGLTPLFNGSGSGGAVVPSEIPLPAAPEGTVESFGAQQPAWVDCGENMQCSDVYAPVDWQNPAGERITLRLIKQPATGGNKLGTVFVNPGGPGASGVELLAGGVGGAVGQSVQRQYDVIGWDPRGVGLSTPVQCLDPAGMDAYLFGAGEVEGLEQGSDEWIAAATTEATAFGAACAETTGDLLAYVGTDSTVQDLDMLRAIAGDDQLNYLGYSYGTYIGALYAEAYPERVGRVVLDGAMDPAASLAEVVREQTRGFEAALRTYVTDCLTREGCPFDGSVDDAMQQISELLDHVEAQPQPASDGRTLHTGTMLTAIITPLYSQGSWPYLDDLFASVRDGDPDTAFWLADLYFDRVDGVYTNNSNEAFSAINCLDYPSDPDPERMRADAAELAEVAPTIGRFQGFGDISCATWPHSGAEERTEVSAKGAAPILVVGTVGDPATPYRWAEALANQLDSGVLLSYLGEGHTAYGKSKCIDELVDDYFLTGAVPASDPKCEA